MLLCANKEKKTGTSCISSEQPCLRTTRLHDDLPLLSSLFTFSIS